MLALLLAGIGVYGVMAYSISMRTHEIGVRVALGATRGRILRLVTREGLALSSVGLAAGVMLSTGLVFALRAVFPNEGGVDLWPLIAGATLLVTAAVVACLLPARRAASVEPVEALRTL